MLQSSMLSTSDRSELGKDTPLAPAGRPLEEKGRWQPHVRQGQSTGRVGSIPCGGLKCAHLFG
eukprot:54129-Eustigmatos_ZCMA.PRE.2